MGRSHGNSVEGDVEQTPLLAMQPVTKRGDSWRRIAGASEVCIDVEMFVIAFDNDMTHDVAIGT